MKLLLIGLGIFVWYSLSLVLSYDMGFMKAQNNILQHKGLSAHKALECLDATE